MTTTYAHNEIKRKQNKDQILDIQKKQNNVDNLDVCLAHTHMQLNPLACIMQQVLPRQEADPHPHVPTDVPFLP